MRLIQKGFVKNKLLPSTDIVKLISQFVPLKKSGADYVCCCPFHNEKTPSCHVHPSRQFYHCFGCGAHGNALDFVMKYKNLEFRDAVEEVARFSGVEIEYEENSSPESRKREEAKNNYYQWMDKIASYFTDQLFKKENEHALNYFMQKRGLSIEVIRNARLGYAPDSFNYLDQSMRLDPEAKKILVDLGIMKNSERDNGSPYTFFRDRVMFPIFDVRGRIIAFGGRALSDDAKAKYLNSPETAIFKKGREIFGLYECLHATSNRPSSVTVVEGYMDAIALRQAGFNNVVATLGTAFTAEHLKLLFRYTDRVDLCFDGDEAGKKASWKAAQVVAPEIKDSNKEARFLFMKPTYDPDTYVRSFGKAGFESLVSSSISLAEFIILHEKQSYDISDPNKRSQFIFSIISISKALSSASMRLVLQQLLKEYLKLSDAQMQDLLNDESIEPSRDFLAEDSRFKPNTFNQGTDLRYQNQGNNGFGGGQFNNQMPQQAPYQQNNNFSRGFDNNRFNRPFDRYQNGPREVVSDNCWPVWARKKPMLGPRVIPFIKSDGTSEFISLSHAPISDEDRARAAKLNHGLVVQQSPYENTKGGLMSYAEFEQRARMEKLEQAQNTPGAQYMNLGPDGMPLSDNNVHQEEFTGEYYEGGRGPKGDINAQQEYQERLNAGAQLNTNKVRSFLIDDALAAPTWVTPYELANFPTVLGRNFNYQEVNPSSYNLLTFMIQDPNMVQAVYDRYKFNSYITFLSRFKVPEFPAILRVFNLIRTQKSINTGNLIEEFRNTDFEPLFNYLLLVEMLIPRENGAEPSPDAKGEYFGRLMLTLINDCAMHRSQEIEALKGNLEHKEDWDEVQRMQHIRKITSTILPSANKSQQLNHGQISKSCKCILRASAKPRHQVFKPNACGL